MATSVRADAWVWSVRLYRSRSLAAAACKAGHVAVNGKKVKPSQAVHVGDRVEARTDGGERVYVVTALLSKRVGAAAAAEAYQDHSPPPLPREERPAIVALRGRQPGSRGSS